MPSWEGLKTWFDYELVFTGLAVVFVLIYWGASRIPPLFGDFAVSGPQLAGVGIGISLSVILLLMWMARGLDR